MNSRQSTRSALSITPTVPASPGDVGPLVITQDFGSTTNIKPMMVGVVYSDANGNSRYDAGEGIGGATVKIVGSAGTFTTTTMSAGGWQSAVPAGTYTVSVSGGTFRGTGTSKVTIGTSNREVDFISGETSGSVDFAPLPNSAPTLAAGSTTLPPIFDQQYESSWCHCRPASLAIRLPIQTRSPKRELW